MIIVGLNAYHGDSSACLIKDGKLVAAAEEERFRRLKHWAGFPTESVSYCLNEAGLSLSDVDHVAINSDPRAHYIKKIGYAIRNRPDIAMVLDRIKNKKKRVSVEDELAEAFPEARFSGKVHLVEHHQAHLSSAHLVSPFKDSVTVSVDGFGDFASAAWGVGSDDVVEIKNRVFFPHSLGVFYQALTQFIGFPHYGDEYKVMGLAPYGEPVYLDQMREVVQTNSDGTFKLNLSFFRHHNEKIEYEWSGGVPTVGSLFNRPALEELLKLPQRRNSDLLDQPYKDLAKSVQSMYEEAFFNLLDSACRDSGIDQLTLAGGCAMNSVANGKIYQRSPFKKVYIQSAAGDAGGAIGAAFTVWTKLGGKREFVMDHAYWGPEFTDMEIGKLLKANSAKLEEQDCGIVNIEDEVILCERTASAIAEGKVIGWFQGRMEWGPRALGNRSILGDPRRTDMKDILNLKIKRRESFRPFAPSVLREAVPDWFEQDDDVPFMMQVYPIREEKRAIIPAVTHVDGSGRLQTVSRAANPRYYKLIKCFSDRTGVPMVLNTSFNENEPVVCQPKEALDCFLRTQMDVLVLGNWFVERASE